MLAMLVIGQSCVSSGLYDTLDKRREEIRKEQTHEKRQELRKEVKNI